MASGLEAPGDDLRSPAQALGEDRRSWRPDPTKSDDEPLPEFPTGGDGHYEPAEREIGKGGVNKLLRSAVPPSNPDLRAEWQEQGIVVEAEVDEPPTAKRSTRKKPAEVPAPNSGG